MENIKELNQTISALSNTYKITRAMKMISSTKLRKIQERFEKSEPYAKALTDSVYKVAGSCSVSHPLFVRKDNSKKIHICLMTADKGLCAGFNSNIIKETEKFIKKRQDEGQTIIMSFLGKRGYEYFKKRDCEIGFYAEGVVQNPTFKGASVISNAFIKGYLADDIDGVYIAYNQFVSNIVQDPIIQRFMPMVENQKSKEVTRTPYILDSLPTEILNELVLKSAKFLFFRILLNSITAEHAARITAMESATTNCMELIDKKTLIRNKARQSAITTELIEIVAGAESLK